MRRRGTIIAAVLAVLVLAGGLALLLAPDDAPAPTAEPAPSSTATTTAPAQPAPVVVDDDPWLVEIAVATTAQVQVRRELPDEPVAPTTEPTTTTATPTTFPAPVGADGQPLLTLDDLAEQAAARRLLEDAHALEVVEPGDAPPAAAASVPGRVLLGEVPDALVGLGAMGAEARPAPAGPAPTVSRERGLTPIPSPGLSWGSAATDDGWTFTNPTPSGNARVFLVTGRQGDWVRVMLPTRPNQQEGWVHRDGLTLVRTRWHVEIDVSENLLRVWEGDRLELETLVVDGRPGTPTPLGRFYINERVAQPPGTFYAPWIFSTNGFSDTLERFTGEVPIFALHGGGWDSTIGTDISNGCVRIPPDVVERMGELLPVGTPIDVHA